MFSIIRVSDVFVKAGISIPNVSIITDDLFHTTCPTCKESQSTNQCAVYEDNGNTFYECKKGCQVIIIVSKATGKAIEGGGYRLKDYVIRNTNDMYIMPPNSVPVLIPKVVVSNKNNL
jgi:hypothetical protein